LLYSTNFHKFGVKGLDKTLKKNFIINVIYYTILAVLVFSVSFVVIKYLFPFVIGTVIAFFVQKPSEYLSRKIGIKKGNIAAFLSIFFYLFSAAVFCFLIYRLGAFLFSISELLPSFIKKIEPVFEIIENKYGSVFLYFSKNFNINFDNLIENTLQKLIVTFGNSLSNFAKSVVKNAPSYFIGAIVTLVATCYIAKDFTHLSKFVKMVIGDSVTEKAVKIKNIFLGSVLKLGKGYLILSAITFATLFAGLMILRVKNAIGIAVIIALADALPVIGTGTIMVPWAVIAVLLGDYYLGIGLALLFVIVVILRNFLEPKIIGKQVGINSLFTLATMFLGLKVLGILGLFLFPIIFIVTVQYYKNEMKEELSN
jgi:sporulation integral membrane protein YtvI